MVKDDLELIHKVIARAALGTVKHHEVSLALQALERVAPVRVAWAWECGRCAWLAKPEGDTVPEHSPRCPIRIERALAWDAGYAEGLRDNEPGTAPFAKNPHR